MEAPVSEAKLASLTGMGFGAALAKRALLLEGGNVERAADMLLTSPPPLDDVDIVVDISGDQERQAPKDDQSLNALLSMGFADRAARNALQDSDGDLQVAVRRLLEDPVAYTSTSDVGAGTVSLDSRRVHEVGSSGGVHGPPSKRRKRQPKCHVEEIDETGRQTSSATVSRSISSSSSSAAAAGSVGELEIREPVRSKDKLEVHTVDHVAQNITFGHDAFKPLRSISAMTSMQNAESCGRVNVKQMVEASVPGVKTMRGERGNKPVTQMLAECYQNGLFMLGPPTSPVNSEIVPAMQHIFQVFSKATPKDAKRVTYLTALAHSCLDCQQVQAREILRTFGDLTSQSDTFEGQLRYSLVRQKEAALNMYISRRHELCDRDHTAVQPWQQRPHLFSGYVALIGEDFGFDGVAAALSDRFLPQVKKEIGRVKARDLRAELMRDMSPKEWLQTLLADINNQTPGSDRLIDRDCIFKWATTNMSQERAHLVFYDEERSHEFADLEVREPAAENQYQPFLSPKVLVDMLVSAGMLELSKRCKR